MNLDHCQFCELVRSGSSKHFKLMKEMGCSQKEVLHETADIIVVADVAPVIDGHALVITKEHQRSMPFWWRAGSSIGGVLSRLITYFSAIHPDKHLVFFEHGMPENEPETVTCVDHAHIHFFVLPAPINEVFSHEGVELGPPRTCINTLAVDPQKQYFALLDNKTGFYFHQADILPSQAIRRLAGKMCGNKFWNWRDAVDFRENLDSVSRIEAGGKMYSAIEHSLSIE